MAVARRSQWGYYHSFSNFEISGAIGGAVRFVPYAPSGAVALSLLLSNHHHFHQSRHPSRQDVRVRGATDAPPFAR